MCGAVARVRWNDFTDAFPAFLTLVATPLTFSIATGLSLGMISFTFLKLATGKRREISPLIWVLTATLHSALRLPWPPLVTHTFYRRAAAGEPCSARLAPKPCGSSVLL